MAAAGKGSSRAMRARRRGLSRLQATKIADQSLGQFPIARRPTRRYPPDARRPSTIARMRRRSSSVSEPQVSITCARSAGSAPDSAPPGFGIVVFPGRKPTGSIPASATVLLFSISVSPAKAAISSGIGSFPPPTCDVLRFPAVACCAGKCASRALEYATSCRACPRVLRGFPWQGDGGRRAGHRDRRRLEN